MIEAPDFLPLGSIVTLQGNDAKQMMIIGRALAVKNQENATEYFDYAMVTYPEGLLGDSLIYSNHDCISRVDFEGFNDEQNAHMVEALVEVLGRTDGITKADLQDNENW